MRTDFTVAAAEPAPDPDASILSRMPREITDLWQELLQNRLEALCLGRRFSAGISDPHPWQVTIGTSYVSGAPSRT